MSGVIRQVINGAIILGISKSAFAGPHPEVRVQRSVLVYDVQLMNLSVNVSGIIRGGVFQTNICLSNSNK